VRRQVWLGLALISISHAVLAFGALGHAVIADLADAQLTPAARAEVTKILAHGQYQHLRDIGSWADQIREDARLRRDPAVRASARYHYLNFPRGNCHYDAERDCPHGACVVGAIQRFSNVLGDRGADHHARLEALKWVVHLVGDVHQPLHAGYADDLGGNRVQIRFADRGSNLHWLWDIGLIEARRKDRASIVESLNAPSLPTTAAQADDVVKWAEASCRMLVDEPIYPAKRTIDRAYVEAMQPLLDRQLKRAGAHLAATLNGLLDPAPR
jgi:hypothetical protein